MSPRLCPFASGHSVVVVGFRRSRRRRNPNVAAGKYFGLVITRHPVSSCGIEPQNQRARVVGVLTVLDKVGVAQDAQCQQCEEAERNHCGYGLVCGERPEGLHNATPVPCAGLAPAECSSRLVFFVPAYMVLPHPWPATAVGRFQPVSTQGHRDLSHTLACVNIPTGTRPVLCIPTGRA